MAGWQALSRTIDGWTAGLGRAVAWLLLVAVFVAAANAVARKLGLGSNAWLETQWLLFSAAFLLVAPWTLARNEHIRIDILSSRLRPRTRAAIDLFGHLLFLLPVVAIVLWTSIPFAWSSFAQGEGSSNFGGLPQWPLKLLIPVAFALLALQAVSEIVKTVAVLAGAAAPPAPPEPAASAHVAGTTPRSHDGSEP